MEKEFVPYELALKLKELGFDEPCLARYCIVTKWEEPTGEIKFQLLDVEQDFEYLVKAPLWQQAFDWFREKHSLLSFIDIDNSYRIYWNNVKHDLDLDSEIFNTYEEARQACLEKLIELCKKN